MRKSPQQREKRKAKVRKVVITTPFPTDAEIRKALKISRRQAKKFKEFMGTIVTASSRLLSAMR